MLQDPQPLEEFERETEAMMSGSPLPGTLPASAFQTLFGAVPYRELHGPHEQRHEWLIKAVLTRGEQGMLVGASQAGKSFLALDMSMAIARGVPWMGCKCRQGLVIYHAGESAKGVRDKRLPAYAKAAGLSRDADLPFILLTKPLDLFGSDEDCNKLIAECKYWQAQYPQFRHELLTIDTFNAATPGADENAGKDVGSIRRRLKRIEIELGCAVLIVHHKNAAGTKARGHGSLFADVENVLDVSLVMTGDEKNPVALKDVDGRKVRVAKVTKLKDGGDEREFRFTLAGVVLGKDEDEDDITSCVIDVPNMGDLEPSDHEAKAKGAARLPRQPYTLLKAIEEALKTHGRCPAPEGVPVPNDTVVVEWRYPRDLFAAGWFGDKYDDPKKRDQALRKAMSDCGEELKARGYIRKHDNWVWRTKKPLPGERRRQEIAAAPDVDERMPEIGEGMAADWLHAGGAE